MLAILSGAMMLSIGILGEYIGRLHFRSMQRPTFLVRVDGGDDGPRAGLPGTRLAAVVEEKHPDEIAAALRGKYDTSPQSEPAVRDAVAVRPALDQAPVRVVPDPVPSKTPTSQG